MRKDLLAPYLDTLRQRALPEGGFTFQSGKSHRPDGTAWAVLAFQLTGVDRLLLKSARDRLAAEQLEDGRVPVSPEEPQAFWPTPLAIYAWYGSKSHRDPLSRAIQFLLETQGSHPARNPDSPLGHDTSILGWPWVADTHSWIEPTSHAILALRLARKADHQRARLAEAMILDRQLPNGGWNYGNTSVFDEVLRPMPETTGMALDALAGSVSEHRIESSLHILEKDAEHLGTPLALAWSVLGLGAWNRRPHLAQEWIQTVLERQKLYGPYDTALLSLLLIAFCARGGLRETIVRGECRSE